MPQRPCRDRDRGSESLLVVVIDKQKALPGFTGVTNGLPIVPDNERGTISTGFERGIGRDRDQRYAIEEHQLLGGTEAPRGSGREHDGDDISGCCAGHDLVILAANDESKLATQ